VLAEEREAAAAGAFRRFEPEIGATLAGEAVPCVLVDVDRYVGLGGADERHGVEGDPGIGLTEVHHHRAARRTSTRTVPKALANVKELVLLLRL
jgi:hypothetical protein